MSHKHQRISLAACLSRSTLNDRHSSNLQSNKNREDTGFTFNQTLGCVIHGSNLNFDLLACSPSSSPPRRGGTPENGVPVFSLDGVNGFKFYTQQFASLFSPVHPASLSHTHDHQHLRQKQSSHLNRVLTGETSDICNTKISQLDYTLLLCSQSSPGSYPQFRLYLASIKVTSSENSAFTATFQLPFCFCSS